ncbi:Hypothetical predicted protein [Cloeon dipterum]|uniref:Uncharacterized protein n=1 Tax=Cloeon dipterum TaxID=197152 RepID=A0A8S1BTH8_9INSE|nr:Hypothetical predicted protein [Cloeon dipterum]
MELKYLICQLMLGASIVVIDAKAVPEKNDVETIRQTKKVGKNKLPDWALQVGSANKMTDPKKFHGKDVALDALENDEGEELKKKAPRRKISEKLKKHQSSKKTMKVDRAKRSEQEVPVQNKVDRRESRDMKLTGTEKTQDFSIDSLLDEDSYRNGEEMVNGDKLRYHGQFEVKNDENGDMFGFRIPLMDENENFWDEDETSEENDTDDE